MSDAAVLSTRAIRVALVGCGRISRNHFEAIERVEGLQLLYVCDIEEERGKEAGDPPIQLRKRAIDRGRFDRIYPANCIVHWTRPQEYYDQAPWRGTWSFADYDDDDKQVAQSQHESAHRLRIWARSLLSERLNRPTWGSSPRHGWSRGAEVSRADSWHP